MNLQTTDEVYSTNDRVREKLKNTLGHLTQDQTSALPPDEKWTIAEIVEHLSMVEDGMVRICTKLLRKAEAEGRAADGRVQISAAFNEKTAGIENQKLEAPQIVHPSGEKSIAESIAKLDDNRARLNDLRPMFESFDGTENKFPHPYFGDLSAHEWLVLIGGHEARHLKQIRKMIEKLQ